MCIPHVYILLWIGYSDQMFPKISKTLKDEYSFNILKDAVIGCLLHDDITFKLHSSLSVC